MCGVERSGHRTMRPDRDPEVALGEFVELWDRLRRESAAPGTVVVVEGERDRRALRRLGLPGPIAVVHDGRPLAGTAHELVRRSRRVVVMTDWDAEGGRLARRLREFLEADHVTLDLEFRRKLAVVLKGEVVHVEGLFGWARRLSERCGTPLEGLLDAE